MDDARVVRRLEPFGDLPAHVERLANRERTAAQALGERLPGHELHDEEALAVALLEGVQGRNPRVIERSEKASLTFEASEPLGIEESSRGSSLSATSRPSDVSRAR